MSLVNPLFNHPLQAGLTTATAKPRASAAVNSAASTSSSTNTSSTSSADAIGSTFLSLLVQELQNQDPTAPMDSTAMVGQMISLNQLNQLTNINQVLSNAYSITPSTSGNTSSGSSSPTSHALSATQAALRLLNAVPQIAHPAVASSVTLPAF